MQQVTSGKKHDTPLDPLTAWELAAINVLISLRPQEDLDVKASRHNMLALISALDRGELDPALADRTFMTRAEDLLLAMLRGDQIDVTDPSTYAARNEIFAAAQVVYNQAVARGFWEVHPEIKKAIQEGD